MRVRDRKSEAELNLDLVLPKFGITLLRLILMFYLYLAHLRLIVVLRDVPQPWPEWHLAPKAQAQRVHELALWMA
jgi:hypothetical protein